MLSSTVRRQLLRQPARACLACRHRSRTEQNIRYSSTASPSSPYEETLDSLRIGKHTRVIFQGFTGRQATANATESIDWGTNIVGGVKPGHTGEHLGLPVLPSVRAAVEALKPDATGIYVPAALAPAAIEEAIEAEVPLVVAVAEHIPLHAILRIASILKTQNKTRLVGANSPGIISATGHCRIGFQPLPCFLPGKVGIAAKSGTLSYEAVASTTRAGLGQSLCIGVGGDIVAGTDLRESLAVLAADPDTEAIALIGEIGGTSELEAADWIKEYIAREASPKPIVALIAGIQAPADRIMGHAGAFRLPGEPSPEEKIDALQSAGATIVEHPELFGPAIKERLGGASGGGLFSLGGSTIQKRGLHTARRARGSARRPTLPTSSSNASSSLSQRRSIYLSQNASFDLLRQHGLNAAEYSGHGAQHYLAITIDRSSKSPCILASPTAWGNLTPEDRDHPHEDTEVPRRFPFDYAKGVDGLLVSRVADHMRLGHSSTDYLLRLLKSLYAIFLENEAFLVECTVVQRLGDVKVVQALFGLDDVSFATRQAANGGKPSTASVVATPQDPVEVEAKDSGIVYVKLGQDSETQPTSGGPPPPATIGTVVNGAGLAMNTVDALSILGGQATNFLDTGGKATSETVKKCFEVLLQDPRLKVIFVNVFGGLTLGDMIARGVVLAFQETNVTVPVVVRIRGTNEEEGQNIIQESGLPLFAFDNFEEAAAKAIELAQQ